ncbi:MAG: hypothetical protein WA061_01825 [Microgenomates group bacterium]
MNRYPIPTPERFLKNIMLSIKMHYMDEITDEELEKQVLRSLKTTFDAGYSVGVNEILDEIEEKKCLENYQDMS